jgi:hypothetical protein
MISRRLPLWSQYAAAVTAAVAATAVRWALDWPLGGQYPFVTYFVAVALVAWYCRTGPAILSLVLSGLATQYSVS